MARSIECDCVGCPQGCIQCGRKHPYTLYTCDLCGDSSRDDDFLEDYGDKEVCRDCFEALIEEEE